MNFKKLLKRAADLKLLSCCLNLFRQRKKTVYISLLILFGLFLLYSKLDLFFAAFVNGQPVTKRALVKELEKLGGQQVLESLITKNLIYQEARKQKIIINEDEINKQVEDLKTQLSNQGMTLESALSMEGQTEDDFRQSLRTKLLVEKMLASKVNISDEEINQYFEDNKDSFAKGATLETVKEQITEALYQDKLATAYSSWIKELKDKAKIKYILKI